MDLRKQPIYLSGNHRTTRRRRRAGNVLSLLFVGVLVAVNYVVFLRGDDGIVGPPLEQRIQSAPAASGAAASGAAGSGPAGSGSAGSGPSELGTEGTEGSVGAGDATGASATEPGRSAGASWLRWPGLGSTGAVSPGHASPGAESPAEPEPPARRRGRDGLAPSSPRDRDLPVDDEEGAVLAGALTRGQTVIQALVSLGIEAPAVYPLTSAMEQVFDFRHARVGDRYSIHIDGKGRLARLEYSTSPLDRYVVQRTAEGEYQAVKRAVDVDTELAEIGCELRSSLYASIKRCGEDPQLATRVVDLFAWDIDFFQDVRDGDRFKLLVEKKYVDGAFLAYGRVLAGEYEGAPGKHRVVWYERSDAGIAGYYQVDGQSVRKEFLKTPLKYTKISAGYTHHRYNPVLQRYKKHLGVDYAAPENAPVWAVASGTVTHVGPKGANGNLVSIRHANGYTSYYAHLAGFADGLNVGDQIDQKQVIGFVGSTGRANGPHLHFAIKHRDRFVDPQKIKFTADSPIPADLFPDFHRKARQRVEAMERIPMPRNDKERS